MVKNSDKKIFVILNAFDPITGEKKHYPTEILHKNKRLGAALVKFDNGKSYWMDYATIEQNSTARINWRKVKTVTHY